MGNIMNAKKKFFGQLEYGTAITLANAYQEYVRAGGKLTYHELRKAHKNQLDREEKNWKREVKKFHGGK